MYSFVTLERDLLLRQRGKVILTTTKEQFAAAKPQPSRSQAQAQAQAQAQGSCELKYRPLLGCKPT
ncbi:hypothetical protein [Pseudidiomarina aquimaris]|uniref:hypothetical protein n=1 Tax=Pseudidiomarina aquimaris TaxID=641841 RepID=UPI003A973B5A